ncbi:Uncharacterised protein [Salmonella enterica subsp. arizonae]|nr:Uncharacterised protein [Salmonella enterica subsp. arizonae]
MADKVTVAAVVGGVDTHKDLHVAAVVDRNNKVLGDPVFRHNTARLPADAGMDDFVWGIKANWC